MRFTDRPRVWTLAQWTGSNRTEFEARMTELTGPGPITSTINVDGGLDFLFDGEPWLTVPLNYWIGAGGSYNPISDAEVHVFFQELPDGALSFGITGT
jgi:hypothetical protein